MQATVPARDVSAIGNCLHLCVVPLCGGPCNCKGRLSLPHRCFTHRLQQESNRP